MKISIITACYNDGIYLEDAFNSIQLNKYSDYFEYIIVNDGSTDILTLEKLSELEQKGAIVIHQENRGLGAARNKAIECATGSYILPLDSDNRIEPAIFLEAMNVMDHDANIDVVYTDALRFGELQNEWIVGPFEGSKLVFENFIDACALIRGSTLLQVGKYDSNMPFMGFEDWELWLNLYSRDRKFYYLPKFGFHYRVRNNSMIRTMTPRNRDMIIEYIFLKHPNLILQMRGEFKKVNLEINFCREYFRRNRIKSIIKILLGKRMI